MRHYRNNRFSSMNIERMPSLWISMTFYGRLFELEREVMPINLAADEHMDGENFPENNVYPTEYTSGSLAISSTLQCEVSALNKILNAYHVTFIVNDQGRVDDSDSILEFVTLRIRLERQGVPIAYQASVRHWLYTQLLRPWDLQGIIQRVGKQRFGHLFLEQPEDPGMGMRNFLVLQDDILNVTKNRPRQEKGPVPTYHIIPI